MTFYKERCQEICVCKDCNYNCVKCEDWEQNKVAGCPVLLCKYVEKR